MIDYWDRFSPLYWAKCFREFLEELFPKSHLMNEAPAQPIIAIGIRARSSPLRFGEWKMKLWKQSLSGV